MQGVRRWQKYKQHFTISYEESDDLYGLYTVLPLPSHAVSVSLIDTEEPIIAVSTTRTATVIQGNQTKLYSVEWARCNEGDPSEPWDADERSSEKKNCAHINSPSNITIRLFPLLDPDQPSIFLRFESRRDNHLLQLHTPSIVQERV